KAGNEAAVFGDIIGCAAEGLAAVGNNVPAVGVSEHRSIGGRTWIAARSAIGLDDDVPAHRPDSSVRTRIRLHSGQRTTSSAGDPAISLRSASLISSRQPWHCFRRSDAAPTPYCPLRRS